jgi:hypothetical protein
MAVAEKTTGLVKLPIKEQHFASEFKHSEQFASSVAVILETI